MNAKATMLAAVLVSTAFTPAMAQSKYIGGAHVEVLPPPACAQPMPWPSSITHYGQPGHPLVLIGKGTDSTGDVTVTDAFSGIDGLAGVGTYLALVGQSGFSSAATYTFAQPIMAMSFLYGSPNLFGHISGWNGATKVFEVTGGEVQNRLAGGAHPAQLNLAFQFRPIDTLIIGSHGMATEIANLTFGAGPECPAQ